MMSKDNEIDLNELLSRPRPGGIAWPPERRRGEFDRLKELVTALERTMHESEAGHVALHRAVQGAIVGIVQQIELEDYAGALSALQRIDAGLSRWLGPAGPDQ
jgi:hypothetical protein